MNAMNEKPWESEPEGPHEFEAAGLPCVVVRGPVGNWNGYIGVPSFHSTFRKPYDDVDVEVHGGLTYASDHAPGKEPDGRWWFGFDTSHYGDFIPKHDRYGSEPEEEYRTLEYVKAECERLAGQFAVTP